MTSIIKEFKKEVYKMIYLCHENIFLLEYRYNEIKQNIDEFYKYMQKIYFSQRTFYTHLIKMIDYSILIKINYEEYEKEYKKSIVNINLFRQILKFTKKNLEYDFSYYFDCLDSLNNKIKNYGNNISTNVYDFHSNILECIIYMEYIVLGKKKDNKKLSGYILNGQDNIIMISKMSKLCVSHNFAFTNNTKIVDLMITWFELLKK